MALLVIIALAVTSTVFGIKYNNVRRQQNTSRLDSLELGHSANHTGSFENSSDHHHSLHEPLPSSAQLNPPPHVWRPQYAVGQMNPVPQVQRPKHFTPGSRFTTYSHNDEDFCDTDSLPSELSEGGLLREPVRKHIPPHQKKQLQPFPSREPMRIGNPSCATQENATNFPAVEQTKPSPSREPAHSAISGKDDASDHDASSSVFSATNPSSSQSDTETSGKCSPVIQ